MEKHFGELCQISAAYMQKTARLWHKAGLLVSTETPTLKQGLKNFADEFARFQDYWQAEVERFEVKVLVEPLKAYGIIVKIK